MLLELFAFFGLMAIAMFAFADMRNYGTIRIMASFILLILGFWVVVDGLQYRTGDSVDISETRTLGGTNTNNATGTPNTYNETVSLSRSETVSYEYAALEWPFASIIPLRHVLAIILWFMGLYGFLTWKPEVR